MCREQCVATWSPVSPKSDISRHYSLNEEELLSRKGSLKAPCFFGVDFCHELKSNLSESRSFKITLQLQSSYILLKWYVVQLSSSSTLLAPAAIFQFHKMLQWWRWSRSAKLQSINLAGLVLLWQLYFCKNFSSSICRIVSVGRLFFMMLNDEQIRDHFGCAFFFCGSNPLWWHMRRAPCVACCGFPRGPGQVREIHFGRFVFLTQ